MNLVPVAPDALVYALIALLIAAAAEDAWRLRISNVLCALVLVGAIVAMAMNFQLALWQNIAVLVIALLVGFPLFAAGKFGGGDIKLLATAGAWFSLKGALEFLIWVLLSGGVLAILIIAARAAWPANKESRWRILRPKGGIPYGIAIAAGALVMISKQI